MSPSAQSPTTSPSEPASPDEGQASAGHGASCGCATGHASGKPSGPLAWVLVKLVRGYQRFLSPMLPPACRFTPSCSEYMRQALIKHGAARGAWLGTLRLLRCHPFHPGGYDPVP